MLICGLLVSLCHIWWCAAVSARRRLATMAAERGTRMRPERLRTPTGGSPTVFPGTSAIAASTHETDSVASSPDSMHAAAEPGKSAVPAASHASASSIYPKSPLIIYRHRETPQSEETPHSISQRLAQPLLGQSSPFLSPKQHI